MSTTQEQVIWEAENAVRSAERAVSSPNFFDPDKYQAAYGTAEGAIAALTMAQADHPSVAALSQRLAGARDKADEIEIGRIKEAIETQKRQAGMAMRSSGDPSTTAEKLQGPVARAREALAAGRGRLDSERGRPVLAEAEQWLAEMETKVAELAMAGEITVLLNKSTAIPGEGTQALGPTLQALERKLQRGDDPEGALRCWNIVEQLIIPLQDPRYAKVDLAKSTLESYASLRQQVDTTLRPALAKHALVNEITVLLHRSTAIPGEGTASLLTTLQTLERKLQRGNDPEGTLSYWNIAEQLIVPLQDPRYAEVDLAKSILESYASLRQQVDATLRPALVQARMKPLVSQVEDALYRIKRHVDRRDHDAAIKARRDLRTALVPIAADWGDEAAAKKLFAECDQALAHSEKELGDGIVVTELQDLEAQVKPVVERLERGLARKATAAVLDHAPRLRARLVALEPFLARQRAAVLKARAEAALARIEPELGSEVATAVAEIAAVTRFKVDLSENGNVQRVLSTLNNAFATYRNELAKGQQDFDDRINLVDGTGSPAADSMRYELPKIADSLISTARFIEAEAANLKEVAPAHPVVQEVANLVPKLVKRAQAWQDLHSKKCEYAVAIEGASLRFRDATKARDSALYRADYAIDASGWPKVIDLANGIDEKVALAVSILPDDHDEADAWAVKAAAARDEAITRLTATCLAEATRLAADGNLDEARKYVDALRTTLPASPENERLAAVLTGAADAKLKASAEIGARRELLNQRALDTATAARPAYEAWAAEKKPIVVLGTTIVNNIDEYKGKWVAGTAHINLFIVDGSFEINGEMYEVAYDPAVKEQLEGGIQRLIDIDASMQNAVMKKHDIAGVHTSTAHYPGDSSFVCEIVGTTMYTPKHDVRDASGRLLGTVTGEPYRVPLVAMRAVASRYYVVVPGRPPSLEALSTEGILD